MVSMDERLYKKGKSSGNSLDNWRKLTKKAVKNRMSLNRIKQELENHVEDANSTAAVRILTAIDCITAAQYALLGGEK